MKNTFIILGFVLCSIFGFLLMQVPAMIMKNQGPWTPAGIHMRNVNLETQSAVDKCKLDRMQGRLKGHAESVQCSNPSFRAAFEKEGFPHMDKVDVFLARRIEFARQCDANKITEDELRDDITTAMDELLSSAQGAAQKK